MQDGEGFGKREVLIHHRNFIRTKICGSEGRASCQIMKRSPLRRVSKKRQRELREYRELTSSFLTDKVCEKCGRKRKLDVHHKAGRGRFYLDVDTWMAVCRECHDYIHKWPKESREKGWLI